MSILPKLLVVLVSIGGGALILFMSKWGIGTFIDTFNYLYGAKSFSDGLGMMNLPQGSGRPLTHFPPLLSLALYSLNSLGLDWLTGALYLNAALFGLSAFSCGYFLKIMTGNWWYGLAGAVFFIVSPSMIYVHSYLLSEPLFLFLSLWCIFFLARYLCRGEMVYLLVSGGFAGMTYLARYAGVSLVGTGIVAIILLKSGRFSLRVKSAFLFCMASGLVIGPLIVRNFMASGGATARHFTIYSFDDKQYINLLHTLRHWFGLLEAGFPTFPLQWSVLLFFSFLSFGWFALKRNVPAIGNSLIFQRSIPVFLQIALLIFAVFLFSLTLSSNLFETDLFMGLVSLITGKPVGVFATSIFQVVLFVSATSIWILFSIKYGGLKLLPAKHDDRLSHNLRIVMFLFAGVYIAMILFSMLFVSARPNLYIRILAPMHMASLICVIFIYHQNQAVKSQPFFHFFNKVIVSAALFILLASYFSFTKGWVLHTHASGLSYFNKEMQLSVINQFVRKLPPLARIYSNEPVIIYFLTGREARPVNSLDQSAIPPNTYLVSVRTMTMETHLLKLDMAKREKELSLKLLAEDRQGLVYRVNPPGN